MKQHVASLLRIMYSGGGILRSLLLRLQRESIQVVPLSVGYFVHRLGDNVDFLVRNTVIKVRRSKRLIEVMLCFEGILRRQARGRLLGVTLDHARVFR